MNYNTSDTLQPPNWFSDQCILSKLMLGPKIGQAPHFALKLRFMKLQALKKCFSELTFINFLKKS